MPILILLNLPIKYTSKFPKNKNFADCKNEDNLCLNDKLTIAPVTICGDIREMKTIFIESTRNFISGQSLEGHGQ